MSGHGALPSDRAVRVTVEIDPPLSIDVEPDPPAEGQAIAAPDAASPVPSAMESPVAEPGPAALATGETEDPGRGSLAHRFVVLPLPPALGQPAGIVRVEVVVDGWRFEALVEPARRAALRDLARRAEGAAVTGRRAVRAPLPGRIVHVWVQPGDEVEAGARLCSLEAMKMENEILAPGPGTIERVGVGPGARVEQGDELVVIG